MRRFHRAAICLSVVSAAVHAAELPTYQVPRVMQPPVLDGQLDDDAWRAAPVITGFVTNRDRKPADFATEVRLVYDADAFYAAVIATEPDLDGLQIGQNPDDVWNDDCIEIFLDPHATRARFFQYIVNAGGVVSSSYVGDFAADIPGQAAAGRTDDAWTLEVRMPFSAFGPAPHFGERWGLNVTRCRNAKKAGDKREITLWCTTDGMHGSPGKFGYLVFASTPGEKLPLKRPDLAAMNRVLERIGAELHGQWRWTDADVNFETRNVRARDLIALGAVVARFPDTRLFYYVRPAIRDEHILPWTVPACNEIGGEINLTACRGEFESASLAVFAVRDLKNVELTFSELTTPEGATLPAATTDPYHVKCWYQAGVGTIHPSATTLLAELLIKDPKLVVADPRTRTNKLAFEAVATDAKTLQPIDVPAFESRQFWITYRVPADAKAGRYSGTVTIRDEQGPCATVPVSLRVPEWALEPSPMIHGLYYGRRKPNTETVEQENAFFELYEQELRDQIEHGCNTVATYVHTGPLLSDPSPCASAQRIHDIQARYGPTNTPYFGVVDHVGFQRGPEQLEAVTKRARVVSEWAHKNGRADFCFMGRDEASGERLREQRPSWEATRKGGAKVWVACGDTYFKDMGDILDYPVVAGGLRPELARKVHANGFKILSYGNPQCGVERPAVYRRNYGLALLAAGYDGAIDYEYRTIDDKSSWDDFDHGHYRDHNFAYPAVGKPIDTIQFEGWREAVDDIRYAATLQKAIRTAVTAGQHVDLAAESQLWLDALTGQEDLDKTRAEMVRRIDGLKRESVP